MKRRRTRRSPRSPSPDLVPVLHHQCCASHLRPSEVEVCARSPVACARSPVACAAHGSLAELQAPRKKRKACEDDGRGAGAAAPGPPQTAHTNKEGDEEDDDDDDDEEEEGPEPEVYVRQIMCRKPDCVPIETIVLVLGNGEADALTMLPDISLPVFQPPPPPSSFQYPYGVVGQGLVCDSLL